MLPYAVVEGAQRLTEAFAEHRRWPGDPAIRQRILVYAGLLAHYAGDLDQPLHTTLHHDGRALPDGSSPKTGIHQLVDGLFERTPLRVHGGMRGVRLQRYDDAWAAVVAELVRSHALVERVYQLEPELRQSFPRPPEGQTKPPPSRPTPAVVTFTEERFRSTASFLASLYWTAWQDSAKVQLPAWHSRPGPGRWDTGRAD
jgi:hypothetical protein